MTTTKGGGFNSYNKLTSELTQPYEAQKHRELPIEQKSSIWFSIQLKASIKPITSIPSNFKGIEPIQEKKIGKYYKYYIGLYCKSKQAIDQCKILKANSLCD